VLQPYKTDSTGTLLMHWLWKCKILATISNLTLN